jgi:hypothetical protein
LYLEASDDIECDYTMCMYGDENMKNRRSAESVRKRTGQPFAVGVLTGWSSCGTETKQ